MDKVKKHQIEARTVYKNLNEAYANQSAIQLTANDVSILLGSNTFTDDGEHVVNMNTLVRMSHQHFEQFVNNCNETLKVLKEEIEKPKNVK